MKRVVISRLFLYRYRFILGYVLLGLAFVGLLFLMPLIAQSGLTSAEMESATSSYNLGKAGILEGDLVDVPYRLLQKLSITIFGLTPYTVKLPSIIIGLLLGFLIILLLNRWFKSNVSLLASCLVVLSTPFLFLAGSGTPLIMLVFWPTLLLWLGSRIHGEKKPKPLYSFIFGIAMLLSMFTPFMGYFAIFCVLFVLFQPHLRFIVKTLPKPMLIVVGLLIVSGMTVLGINIVGHPDTLTELFLAPGFEMGQFFPNIAEGLAPVFSWHGTIENVFLSPLISLPMLALALIGLFSTTKGFFASRNSIATILLVFCVIITGFNPSAVILFVLPFAILTAHGLKYLLEKWYGLFPKNPYARVSAILPLAVLFGLIIVPEALHYIYGYRYNPNIATGFNYDLGVIRENLADGVLVVGENYDFYKILEGATDLSIIDFGDKSTFDDSPYGRADKVAFLGRPETVPTGYGLSRIITSPMRENSDIIYVYTYTEKGE